MANLQSKTVFGFHSRTLSDHGKVQAKGLTEKGLLKGPINSFSIKSTLRSGIRQNTCQLKKNPKGYHHEDFGVISYDKTRKKFVFRQFHIEGFVNHYSLESISPDGKTITFVTESIENIPPGWRGRETYTIAENEFSEAFDLAEPRKDFEPYTRASFKRNK